MAEKYNPEVIYKQALDVLSAHKHVDDDLAMKMAHDLKTKTRRLILERTQNRELIERVGNLHKTSEELMKNLDETKKKLDDANIEKNIAELKIKSLEEKIKVIEEGKVK